MIIEIKDLPKGQKIQRISVNVEFCDSSESIIESVDTQITNSPKSPEQNKTRNVPVFPEIPEIPESIEERPAMGIPAEMLELDL